MKSKKIPSGIIAVLVTHLIIAVPILLISIGPSFYLTSTNEYGGTTYRTTPVTSASGNGSGTRITHFSAWVPKIFPKEDIPLLANAKREDFSLHASQSGKIVRLSTSLITRTSIGETAEAYNSFYTDYCKESGAQITAEKKENKYTGAIEKYTYTFENDGYGFSVEISPYWRNKKKTRIEISMSILDMSPENLNN